MVGMPFHLEKGPSFAVLSDYLSDDTRAVGALKELRSGNDLTGMGWLNSTTLNYPPYPTLKDRADHIKSDWLGERENPPGVWHKQGPFDEVNNPTTGFWRNWYGDAEEILRTTFARAIEVALGMTHGQEIPEKPARHWPIDVFWKCPQPWLEGWISWRSEAGEDGNRDAGYGQVTVVLCTPGNGHPVLLSPLAPPAHGSSDYAEEPKDCSSEYGMWVVTHRKTLSTIEFTVEPTDTGEWILPTFGPLYHGDKKLGIVTVAPSEPDGGILHSGRQYIP